MFHRVKSEPSQRDTSSEEETMQNEAQLAYAEPAAPAVETASSSESNQASSSDAADSNKVSSPAQGMYQRPAASAASISRPSMQYASRPAGSSVYMAPAARPAAPAPSSASLQAAAAARSEANSSASSEGNANDRRLTIGRGITLSGEIEHCDHLLVEGTVEAALKGANFLRIAESGVFYGTVEIEEATIAGRFEGEIIVHGRLTVESTGVITGSISYSELAVESGAILDGRITPVAARQNAAAAQPKASAAKKAASAPANAEASLFTTEAAE